MMSRLLFPSAKTRKIGSMNGTIMRAVRLVMAGSLAILAAACTPESENPLPDDTRAGVDERLIGTWAGEVLGNRHVAEVTRGAPGVLEVKLASVTIEGAKQGLAPTESRHQIRFHDLLGTPVIAEQGPSLIDGEPVYRFASYHFGADGALMLNYTAEKPIFAFVAPLKMRGTFRANDPVLHDVIVQAAPDKLAAVMRRYKPADLFKMSFGPFKRQ